MHRFVDGRRLGDGGVANPAGVDDAHEKRRHIVEHDGDDHFVLPARDLENARNHAPDAAGKRTGKQRQNDARNAGQTGEVAGEKRCHRAHQELPLAAEVKYAAFIREARAKSGEHERRRLGQRRADAGF